MFSIQDADIALRLVIATFLGAIIGFEREIHGKEAGFRTYSLVCLGSAIAMVVSIRMHDIYSGNVAGHVDPSRIAAQVVSGIGFLGAGAIIRFPQGIRGLTTAAGIWAAAGIGLACGMGEYRPACYTTVLVFSILVIFPRIFTAFVGKSHYGSESHHAGKDSSGKREREE